MSNLRGFVCGRTLNYRLILAGSISPTGGWFEPPPDIIEANTEATLQRYRDAFLTAGSTATPKVGKISEEVLNDMVFGYCVRLSEFLFPIKQEREGVPIVQTTS
jgi:hypothetical protein